MIYGSQSPRVVIATPMRDLQVSGPHYASAWTFMGSNLGIIDPQILVDDDLVRARSRAVRLFLETSAAYLLFWDSDVEGSAEALRGMIAEDVDCIASTYPKKKLDAFGQCKDFALYTEGERINFTGKRAEVPAVGLGFMLCSRRMLETMVSHYDEEQHFYDGEDRTVAIFNLIRSPDHRGVMRLWPEDYSFCRRVWEVGFRPHLYTGAGSPLRHVGMHIYSAGADALHPTVDSPK